MLGQGHFTSTSHKIYSIQKVRRLRNILSDMKSIIGCSNTLQISGISTLKVQSNPALWTPGLYRYLILQTVCFVPGERKPVHYLQNSTEHFVNTNTFSGLFSVHINGV